MNKKTPIPFQFVLGLLLALGAGVTMLFDAFPLGWRIVVGMFGVLLIATSRYKLL